MQTRYSSVFISIFVILLLSSCATKQLSYNIDPEISTVAKFADQTSLIAVTVVDQRETHNSIDDNEITVIAIQKNDAEMIRTKLIENFKQNNYKIISNPLLADISIELQIHQLIVAIKKDFLKSQIKVTSKLGIQIISKNETGQNKNISKTYKMTRTQEVANPVNSGEITGVVNQLLSKQLDDIWSDSGLSQ